MINIEIPDYDVVIYKTDKLGNINKPAISSTYGFIDYEDIPRNVPGIYMFFNENEELLYVGQTKSLRQRIRKHFHDDLSAIRFYRDEVYKIAVFYCDDAFKREMYETYIIHTLRSKYNIDKVFFDR